MSPELPAGTVAFLFTDIEASTRLVSRIGDAAYGSLLAQERALVVAAALAEGGVPFGSEGDAHFVAFASAAAAVRAAVRAQRALASHAWPEGQVLSVRMGVHAGEVQLVDGEYVGYEVHRAARVAAAAHGGPGVGAGAARGQAGAAGAGIALRDLGEHSLRDVAHPERLFQVVAPDLRTDFPAPRTAGPVVGNLPAQLTSFVGRSEVADAQALLDTTRLLTLTGPGGTGKTRLSLEVASGCAERFRDGAWFVPLAAVQDPELVPSAIAGALGLLSASQPPLERLREHLSDRQTLLVLDNLEQVLGAAPMVSDLLRTAPRLTVIASSRAPLRVAGEQEFPVPPLALPPRDETDPAVVAASEAGNLFAKRAAAVRPGFTITRDNAAHVTEIVRRLDGLPLAIELAAARIRLLPPHAMARRLDDRLGLLSGGGRDATPRQRTLRGAIDWSHDLLAAEERRLFARLGVFAGSGPIGMVDEVCVLPEDRGEDGGPAEDVITVLEHLAEQSLVRIEEDAHGDIRFSMLETLREYAAERLEERGEAVLMAGRHADAMLDLLRSVPLTGDERGTWLDRMDEEHDNLRAAVDRAIEAGDHETASSLVFGAWRFWQMRGHVVEGRQRVGRVLAMHGWPSEPSVARLRAYEAGGGLAYWAGDMTAAGEAYGAGVVEARRLGDDAEIANAVYNHWFTRRPTGNLGDWASLLADDDKRLLDEALEIWTRLGDDAGIAKALWGLGEHHSYRLESDAAEDATSRALAIFERQGDTFWISWTRFTRAFARATADRVGGAAEDIAVAMRTFRTTGDVSGLCLAMSAMASLLLRAGHEEAAYAIGAAANRAIAETGIHIASLWPTDSFPLPDPQRAEGPLLDAAERGRAWTREQALDEAIRLADELAARSDIDPDRPVTA